MVPGCPALELPSFPSHSKLHILCLPYKGKLRDYTRCAAEATVTKEGWTRLLLKSPATKIPRTYDIQRSCSVQNVYWFGKNCHFDMENCLTILIFIDEEIVPKGRQFACMESHKHQTRTITLQLLRQYTPNFCQLWIHSLGMVQMLTILL